VPGLFAGIAILGTHFRTILGAGLSFGLAGLVIFLSSQAASLPLS
jgi:hypothetical protein